MISRMPQPLALQAVTALLAGTPIGQQLLALQNAVSPPTVSILTMLTTATLSTMNPQLFAMATSANAIPVAN